MSDLFKTICPPNEHDIRQSIYNGDIYILPPTSLRLGLCDVIGNMLNEAFPEKAQTIHIDQDDYKTLDRLAPLKHNLTKDAEVRIAIRALLSELGLSLADYAIDVPRLRANIPSGYKNADAEVAYAAHRDTWYSNPKSQINFWMPIFDTNEKQSFAFYPDYFDRGVKNNSADFDYDTWIAHSHPTTEQDLKNPVSFSAPAGSLVIFSAAHLHQGLAHDEDTIRYSIDFRVVHRGDFEKDIGAPDPDNQSVPHAFDDYLASGI